MKIVEYMDATAVPARAAGTDGWLVSLRKRVAAVLRQARTELAELEAERNRQRRTRIANEADDPRNFRCGHNFPPEDCPYEHCHVRTMAILFDAPIMPTMPKIADAIRTLYASQEHRPSLDAVLAAVERAGRAIK